MDYNIKDIEKTVSELQRRVDELERLLEGQERHEFKYSAAEQLYHQRVSRLNTKGGESHTDWEAVPIVSETGSVVPDGTNSGDLLYWNGTAWTVFARPASGNYFVMFIGGVLSVVKGEAFTCP